MSPAPIYLNLGCGSRYHPEWLNLDVAPCHPEVIQYDLTQGIPLPEASCQVVYHAAVLEHLRRSEALPFMAECYRVLKPGGIVRVGVPDLEKLCQLYLSRLAAARRGDETAARDYDWIMMELFDQCVRERSGGDMLEYLRQNPLPNETFVFERLGVEGRQLVQALRQTVCPSPTSQPAARQGRRDWRSLLGLARVRLAHLLLSAADRRALEIGRFRLAGEVHHWLYDRYSLARLLTAAGFQDLVVQGAHTSRIPGWEAYHLDTLPDGQVIKPDLFFMEGLKPEAPNHG